MSRDELVQQIDFCLQEGRAMREHRDHEFARGAYEAADKYRAQLSDFEAAVRRRARKAADRSGSLVAA